MNLRKLKPAALAIALASTLPAWAAWPDDKPIEVVVGFAAGGGTDLLARKLLPFVQKRLGPKAQFVVQNKPGAAGEIANAYVARAKADGYTLAVVNVPGFLFLPMTRKTQYQVGDFQLIARVVDDPTVMVTKSDNKTNSFQALLAALKQNPGSLAFGHNGTGTNGDLALQLLEAVERAALQRDFVRAAWRRHGHQRPVADERHRGRPVASHERDPGDQRGGRLGPRAGGCRQGSAQRRGRASMACSSRPSCRPPTAPPSAA